MDNELSQRSAECNGLNDANAHRITDNCTLYCSAGVTKMETILFIHKWKITQFSVQQELSSIGENIESSTFGSSNNEYKFRLKLFPSGKDDDCRGYLSLFLQIIKCPSNKIRFRVNFYIDASDGPRGCALNKDVVTIHRGGFVSASKFFPIETLKSRTSRFLPDDVLTVVVELTVYGEHSSMELDTDEDYLWTEGTLLPVRFWSALPRDQASASFAREIGQLFEDPYLWDFMINTPEASYRCHKAVLSARSPYFSGMFRHENNEENKNGEVTFDSISGETMKCVLEFMYKDSCGELWKNASSVMAAADRFCLDKLKAKCQEHLVRDMNISNVCERLRVADLYNAVKIKRKALSIFQRNRQAILASREWLELEHDCPALAASVLKEVLTYSESYLVSINNDSQPSAVLAKKARIARPEGL